MNTIKDYGPFVVVLIVGAIDVLCTDGTWSVHNPWPGVGLQNNYRTNNDTQNLYGTTPWPPLRQTYQNAWSQTRRTWFRPTVASVSSYDRFENGRNTAALGSPKSNSGAVSHGDQVQTDRVQVVPGEVTDDDLRELSEALLQRDTNNAARFVDVRYQGKTSSRSVNDEAPQPLLKIQPDAYNIPTVSKLIQLYDNYIVDTNQHEDYTQQEKTEEEEFLREILKTPVIVFAKNFLISKGKISRDSTEFKSILQEIWFTVYRRGGRGVGSSGFEHVFLSEVKNNQVSGLHNWIFFSHAEERNEANYLGYMRKVQFQDKGAILKYHFSFNGIDKPVGSMFIGTSPEFEMALYTICFLVRADRVCPLKLGGSRFIIRTFTYRYKGKNLIGSAFPEI